MCSCVSAHNSDFINFNFHYNFVVDLSIKPNKCRFIWFNRIDVLSGCVRSGGELEWTSIRLRFWSTHVSNVYMQIGAFQWASGVLHWTQKLIAHHSSQSIENRQWNCVRFVSISNFFHFKIHVIVRWHKFSRTINSIRLCCWDGDWL